ncbi:MAG: hypothetical protein M3680_12880 [Myxococcota bacterium]|nr:hypothetical protein [Myxococcota bacterium]
MIDAPDRRAATRALKQLAYELLTLADDEVVMVTELHCTEPGCPPTETIIAVLRIGARQQLKIHKPLIEVTRADVIAAIAGSHVH